jgi:hypothetical protein
MILKECSKIREFLRIAGYNFGEGTGALEKAVELFYDFYFLNVNRSLYLFYRYSEKDDLKYGVLRVDEYGHKMGVGENYVITFFRDTCSFGFALMSQDYDYLDGNDDRAEKKRFLFLESKRNYLREISVSDIDLSNHEEIPYLKPMANSGTSFGSRFMKLFKQFK